MNGTLGTHVLSLGGEYDLTQRLTLLLQQDLTLGGDARYFSDVASRMTTTAGGRYKLTDALALTLAAQARWDGANSGILGIRVKTGDKSHIYANERMTLLPGRRVPAHLVSSAPTRASAAGRAPTASTSSTGR